MFGQLAVLGRRPDFPFVELGERVVFKLHKEHRRLCKTKPKMNYIVK